MTRIAPALPLTVLIRPGAYPARQGEPCAGLFVVETGALSSGWVTDDGRRLAELLGPGDAVGGPDGVPSPVTVRSLRACRLRHSHPSERPVLLAARAERALAFAHELAWLNVTDRVERRLQEAAERFGGPVLGGRALGMRLTQDELAELAGTTRESANRAVRALVQAGRLRLAGRGRYVIPGLAAAS